MSEVTSALLAGAICPGPRRFTLPGWRARSRNRASRARSPIDEASIRTVIADAADVSDGTAGVITWAGSWNGQRVQLRTIVDTLATRKLPARWLSVSITEKVAVPAHLRHDDAAGLADDLLQFRPSRPYAAEAPRISAEAVLRTDRRGCAFPAGIIADHLEHLCRRARQGIADHAERACASSGCWPRPSGRATACSGRPNSAMRRTRSGADRETAAVDVGAARRHQPSERQAA